MTDIQLCIMIGVPMLFNALLTAVVIAHLHTKFGALDRRFDALIQRFDQMLDKS